MADDEPLSPGGHSLWPTLALLGVAACVTLFFVVKLQPSSVGAFAFAAVWLTLPHAAMAALLLALQRRGKPLLPWCIAAALVAVLGLYVLVDAIYLHPDAQSAIAVVIAPVLQGIVFLLAAPLAWWAGRRRS
jgi:hypothetical protein